MNCPLILSTWSFGAVASAAGWELLKVGASAGDAVEAAANAVENDEAVDSVGLGGLPDIDGEVVLDAAFMESPEVWGSVLAVRDFRNPVSIARRLAERFGRAIRVGRGAEEFAESEGFGRERLLTEKARSWWEGKRGNASFQETAQFFDGGDGTLFLTPAGERMFHDTVGIVALDSKQGIAAATSTSGLPLKPKDRVGDSALLGHGIYVEPGIGAVASTGTGELISSCCCAVRIIDALRDGASIADAFERALSLLSLHGGPKDHDQAAFICVTSNGEFGAAALRPGFRYSVLSPSVETIREPDVVLLSR